MTKHLPLLLAAAVALAGATAHAQPGAFDTMEKMKMRWDLAYKLKPGDIVKYEIDSISAQKISSFNVAEAGSEQTVENSTTSRVYLTQRVVDVDPQGVATLEFIYDNVVYKQAQGGQEQVLDTSALAGRKFTVRVSSKGKIVDVEGSGDTGDFTSTLQSLFLPFPDQTLKIGDEWESKHEEQSVDPTSGLQISQSTAVKYRVKDFEEYQRRDTVVLQVFETIDQQLAVAQNDQGGTITSTRGEGTGNGSSKGTIRVDAKTGQIVTLEKQLTLRNQLTVDEEQLVGPTIRTKLTTELTTTTNTRIQ